MRRPLFKDYAKQFFGSIFLNCPVVSQDKCYTFADRPMLLLMQLPFALAMLFAYNYSPYSIMRSIWPAWIAVSITLLLLAAYWLFFVYRFARFSAQGDPAQSNPSAAEDQNVMGVFTDTPQARRSVWRSRSMFGLLALALAGITSAYCILGFGLAPWRLYNHHKESLNRLAEIAEEYEDLYIYPPETYDDILYVGGLAFPENENGFSSAYEPSEATVQEIGNILNSFHNGYISSIMKSTYDGSFLYVNLNARWGRGCDLIWSPVQVSMEKINSEFADAYYQNVIITQFDSHWWMVWYDFDTEAY